MTVAEFFVEQHSWPDSRKTAWLFGCSMPFLVIGPWGYFAAIATTDTVRMLPVVLLVSYGSVGGLVAWLCGLFAWRAGKPGRWTAYLAVVLFCSFTCVTTMCLGTWSSIFLLWFPMTVLLCAIWYDVHLAIVALLFQTALLTTGSLVIALGPLDYAPFLAGRTIDEQDSAGWIVATLLASGVGALAAIALGFLAAAARELQEKRLQAAFAIIRTYVPGQVADALLADTGTGTGQHERRRLTIFFSDLVGFTDLSDDYEPEDLSRLLNEYFAEMTAIADEYGGTIDELSGDAVLVFFGAPEATTDRDHALRAVRMARDMQSRLQELNRRWADEGRADRLQARMGVDTGVVTVGNFGSPQRMKYAALGRHVNAAARLQTSCPPGGILVAESTWLLVRDEIPCSPHGSLTLKGLHKPVETYLVEQGGAS